MAKKVTKVRKTRKKSEKTKILNFKHPKDVGLDYFQHLCFTWKESILSLVASVVMLIHGIFPPLFDFWYSEYIRKTQKRIDNVGVSNK